MEKQNKSPDKTAVLQYTLKSVSELTANRRNARTHSKSQIKKIANSIKEFGFISPAIIDKDGVLVAGHGRLEAAKSLGMTEIPCLIADHLTPAQLRAYMLADNRIQLDAGWDEEILKVELGELSDIGFNIDLTGFDISEVEGHLRHKGFVDGEDDVPETPENPVSKLGDVWILGEHRVCCGDSTSFEQVEKLMNGQKADMVFTDPPYGINVQTNQDSSSCKNKIMGDETTEVAVKSFKICQTMNIPMIFWGANHYSFDAELPNSKCWISWNKQEKNNHIDQADCELAWTNINSPARQFHHLWAGFRRDSEVGETRIHPTQKPVELIVEILDLFKKLSKKTILDLFGGSGSTLIACEKTKRNCLMMEIDPKYCDVIINRWQTFTGKTAILEATGEPFPEKELKAISEA